MAPTPKKTRKRRFQREQGGLARNRRCGGIVSLQAEQPHAHWINAFVSSDDSPPNNRPTTQIVAVTQHKPEA
jgi:hypothetical protein